MSKPIAIPKALSHEEWLEQRRQGIGGSDIAAIAGLNPWRSPLQVYLEKLGEMPPEPAGQAAAWGNKLEDLVAREFAERTGLKVQRRNAILIHPEHPWAIANLDREIVACPEGRGLLEVKTTSAWKREEWGEEEIPTHVVLQVQWYLAVTGYPFAYVAVLIGGQEYRHYRFDRDEELIEHLLTIGGEFWSFLERRIPPDVDATPACTETLKLLYPKADPGKEVILPDEAKGIVELYHAACEREKAAKEDKDLQANRLRSLLEDAEVAYLPGVEKPIASYKQGTTWGLDTKALEAEHPDLVARYRTKEPPRTLRVNKVKEVA